MPESRHRVPCKDLGHGGGPVKDESRAGRDGAGTPILLDLGAPIWQAGPATAKEGTDMSEWFEFGAALALFMLSHAIPVRPPARPWLVVRLGLRGYLLAYSVLSLAVFYWLIVAAARAPYVQVIPPLDLLRWLPLLAMPVVCLLAVAGLAAANPLSFGGMGRGSFDPERPGILGLSRHPLLLAAAIWAGAHLLANGDLAHVILFGLFAGFAIAGMALIDRRKRRDMGAGAWGALSRNTAWLSLARLRRVCPPPWQWAVAAIVYGALIWLHAPVIGVPPLP